MQLSLLQLVWGVAAVLYSGNALASSPHLRLHHAHRALAIRAPTPDNTCGGAKGYSCDANIANGGACCSVSGYCGNTAAYCGTGCQPAFGTCNTPGSTTPVFDEFECGLQHGSQKCKNGLCCSINGFCGSTVDYCGTGCQAQFGQCTSLVGTAKCGNSFGGARCPAGQCCNPEGNCGTEKYDCRDPDCQWQFGRCDSDTTPKGPSTLTDPRPRLGQVTYDQDIYSCTKPNVVALTYDDGPYIYTAKLLDLLKQYGFTATFYVTGNNLGKGSIDTAAPWPDLLKRMVNEGHQIASHTWSHYSLTSISSDMRKQQMVKNERAIANVIGKYPTYMRPPYSQCDDVSGCNADMKALGYHRTYFDLDTQDTINFLPTTIFKSREVVQQLLGISTRTNFLAIQHDLVEPSVSDLSPFLFESIKNKGWKGVTAGECLQDPKENWYRIPGTGAGAGHSSSTIIKPVSTPARATPTPNTGHTGPCAISATGTCGTWKRFTNKAGCLTSLAHCNAEATKCNDKAGRTRCQNACKALATYCHSCTATTKCESAKFHKNGE